MHEVQRLISTCLRDIHNWIKDERIISNSLPTNEDICPSVVITWSVCYSACTKVLCFTGLLNMRDRPIRGECHVLYGFLWKNSVSPAKKRWRKWNENAKKTGLGFVWYWGCWSGYDVKQLKFISRDSVTNTMSRVITIMKGITFPSFGWKNCFSPRKVRWRIEATFFTGNCIVASRDGPAEKMTPRCA